MSYVLGSVRRVPLSRGFFAIVSVEDFRRAMKHKWSVFQADPKHRYATTTHRNSRGRWTKIYLHRFVMSAPAGILVDHKNRDGLDCTRINLRFATHEKNGHNSASNRGSSQFKGVSWSQRDSVWVAHIHVAGRTKYLGSFSSEYEGAIAYDDAARQFHGEFARPNFPCQIKSDFLG